MSSVDERQRRSACADDRALPVLALCACCTVCLAKLRLDVLVAAAGRAGAECAVPGGRARAARRATPSSISRRPIRRRSACRTRPDAASSAWPIRARGIYRPDPLGAIDAREAVAADVRRAAASPSIATSVVLTASTSEAYAFLFKLLCDPGDAVLVPQPSYPLFELLTRLEGVRAARRIGSSSTAPGRSIATASSARSRRGRARCSS